MCVTNRDEQRVLGRDGHLTELTADRLMLGELAAAERTAVETHLDACAACAANLAALRRFDERFAADGPALPAPPPVLVEASSTRSAGREAGFRSVGRAPGAHRLASPAPPRRRARRRLAPAGGALLSLAAALVIVLAWPRATVIEGPGQGTAPGGIRSKGGINVGADVFPGARHGTSPDALPDVSSGFPRLGASVYFDVFVKNAEGVRAAADNVVVHPGERIGFRLFPSAAGHVMVVGLDDRAKGYLCYPQHAGGRSSRIEPEAGGIVLEEAMRLDAVMGRERIVALLCARPFSFEEVRNRLVEAANTAGTGPLPAPVLDGCVQHELTLVKRPAGPRNREGER